MSRIIIIYRESVFNKNKYFIVTTINQRCFYFLLVFPRRITFVDEIYDINDKY